MWKLHEEDNVPTLVNILEASSAAVDSPLAVIRIILVELTRRTAPITHAHYQSGHAIEATCSGSSNIVTALHTFKSHNHGRVHAQAYTSVSPFDTMHDEHYIKMPILWSFHVTKPGHWLQDCSETIDYCPLRWLKKIWTMFQKKIWTEVDMLSMHQNSVIYKEEIANGGIFDLGTCSL